ncbi:MAG: elongation factor G [Caldisericota bacterium]|nr:elongation factor G [Caldisericota bacterium]
MKLYKTENIRNVVVVGHGNAGKTTLSEAILFKKKLVSRMGKVEDGTTVSDYQPEEKEKSISIGLSIVPFEHNEVKVNFIDVPGYPDFIAEALSGIRAGDNGLIVINAVAGVEIQTKRYWNYLVEINKPRAFFINKIDVEGVELSKIIDNIKETFGSKAFPIIVPIMDGKTVTGVYNLLSDKEPPDGVIPNVSELKKELIEIAAEGDDALLEKYLGGEGLTPAEIRQGLKRSLSRGEFFPILVGSALTLLGIDELIDFMVDYMVSPDFFGVVKGMAPKTNEEEERKISADDNFSAFVFKTVSDPYVGKLSFIKVYSGLLGSNSTAYNSLRGVSEKISQLLFVRGSEQIPADKIVAGDMGIITKLLASQTNDTLSDKNTPIVFSKIVFPTPMLSRAMRPKSKADEDRMSIGLSKIMDEDPTIIVTKNVETNEQIISGVGEAHLSIIMEKLKKRYNVNIELTTPKVPYRETITGKIKVEGKYKKQTGGHGQYGHCWLEVEPLSRGKEFEFVNKIFGGAIPKQYVPAVEKGVKEAMSHGILAGYPVVNIKVTVVDGSYHPVDSSEMAFKVAGSMALKKALEQCNPIILEPVEKVEIIVDEQYMGEVIGDINSKRGKVLGMKSENGRQIIEALVPLAEILSYSNDLNSITQGTGVFTQQHSRYEPAPPKMIEKVIQSSKIEEKE